MTTRNAVTRPPGEQRIDRRTIRQPALGWLERPQRDRADREHRRGDHQRVTDPESDRAQHQQRREREATDRDRSLRRHRVDRRAAASSAGADTAHASR